MHAPDDFSKLPVIEMGTVEEFYSDYFDIDIIDPAGS
jgi:hypothetical protein